MRTALENDYRRVCPHAMEEIADVRVLFPASATGFEKDSGGLVWRRQFVAFITAATEREVEKAKPNGSKAYLTIMLDLRSSPTTGLFREFPDQSWKSCIRR